jgi:exodeoxyribonuclease X
VRRALTDTVLVAHNAHVDVAVLRRELGGWESPEVFDTLKLARRLLPGQPSYKLGALVQALSLDDGLPLGLEPHRAAYDVLVTARLFVRLATRDDGSPLSLDELRGREGDQKPGGTDETASLF